MNEQIISFHITSHHIISCAGISNPPAVSPIPSSPPEVVQSPWQPPPTAGRVAFGWEDTSNGAAFSEGEEASILSQVGQTEFCTIRLVFQTHQGRGGNLDSRPGESRFESTRILSKHNQQWLKARSRARRNSISHDPTFFSNANKW